jgi:hypothetical protein
MYSVAITDTLFTIEAVDMKVDHDRRLAYLSKGRGAGSYDFF